MLRVPLKLLKEDFHGPVHGTGILNCEGAWRGMVSKIRPRTRDDSGFACGDWKGAGKGMLISHGEWEVGRSSPPPLIPTFVPRSPERHIAC